MRRQALAGLVLAVSAGLAVVGACGFPDADFFADGDSSTRADSPAGDAPSDAGGDAPAIGANEDVDPNGKDKDASAYDPDAGNKIDAAGCTTCDCDGDKFLSQGVAGCTGGPGAVYDCDDTDPFINPAREFV